MVMAGFPEPQSGVRYFTEGGTETELMYKHGHELPEFAVFPLLDSPRAVEDLKDMYRRYFETVAAFGAVALVGGLDYRASPDWAGKLGIDAARLEDYQHRCIQFLRDAAAPFADQIPQILIAGVIGPRGDAYGTGEGITSAEAEDYHSVQLATLRAAGVDIVSALTFNNIPEAIGVARATAAAGLPLSLSFLVNAEGRIFSGPALGIAIEQVDAQTGDARPDFYGINCAHPIEFEPALTGGDWLGRVRSLRPNASTTDKQSLCTIGHLEAGDPEQLGKHIAAIARRMPNVDIVGGCCGTWDDHLTAIATELGH